MEKIELYDIHMKKNYMEGFIWGRWFAWKENRQG